jgi:hypothetical protein
MPGSGFGGAGGPDEEHQPTPARARELHAVAAQVQSLATTVSRLPQFPRRFTEALLQAAGGV